MTAIEKVHPDALLDQRGAQLADLDAIRRAWDEDAWTFRAIRGFLAVVGAAATVGWGIHFRDLAGVLAGVALAVTWLVWAAVTRGR